VAFAAGTRLGVYEIVALIGSGGMGEVYRARDSRLNRDVAIKVLPADVAADPERLARFEREAQVLASLNHSNIANIYGVDDSSGTPALVMELVEGPTLADRIAKGPIPLDETLPIAKQIAEALEAAHEQGIIHRDLKPANIKVRPDGTVKVLDFGLAKAFDPNASGAGNATMSPTLSIHATQGGIILGTAAYMSPEQARGQHVDKRTDIWAFGCVLYELLTGTRAFEGNDTSTILASVLTADPDWERLPRATSPGLRRLLFRCLRKNPKDRLQAIGDARVEIGDLLGGATQPDVVAPGVTADLTAAGRIVIYDRWRRVGIPVATLLVGSIATGVVVWSATRSTDVRPRASRFEITLPSTAALSIGGVSRDVALTPDGSRLVYVGANGTTLFVRPLDQLEPIPLVRGSGLRNPFVSPDGQWVGFYDGNVAMRKVPVTGGPAVLVAQLGSFAYGAAWGPDGTIIFASAETTGLQRVSADGGEPSVLTRPDRAHGESAHLWPQMLPGGQFVLCTVRATDGGPERDSIAALDLRNSRLTILLRGGSDARYMPSGHLVYAAEGTLRAIGFDPVHLRVVGTARPVVSQVITSTMGGVEVAAARDGTFVYVIGTPGGGAAHSLVWVDRQGRETALPAPPRVYSNPRISPDGTRIAVSIVDQDRDIWLWDLARETLTRVTLDPAASLSPEWTPDGRRIVFSSTRAGQLNLFSQAADGTGPAERLTESPVIQAPTGVLPDGARVLLTERSSKTGADVMMLPLDGTHHVLPLVQTSFDERNGIVSPDGRWLAYEANDTGVFEVYVRPYPDVGRGRWQVSTNGGTQPLWAHNGQELFYLARDGALMRVGLMGGSSWTVSKPTKVLEGRYVVATAGVSLQRNYDIAADDRQFLMIKDGGAGGSDTRPQIVIIQHFDEELKRLVPLK
jgi:serine/threonine-protein kinase